MNNTLKDTLLDLRLSPVEWETLAYMGNAGPGKPESLATAVAVSQEIDEVHFEREDVEKAIENILRRRLAIILTQSDCERDLQHRNSEAFVCAPMDAYFPGQIDLTQQGYNLFRNVVKTALGLPLYVEFDNGIDLITILSEDEKSCCEASRRISMTIDSYLEFNAKLFLTTPVAKIVPLRINRFELLPVGYRALIQVVRVTA